MSQIITNLTSLPSIRTGVSGRFRGILRDLMGRPVYDTGWFDNDILDSGIEWMGDINWYSYMYIGSNGTATNPVTMTGIQTFLALAGSIGAGGAVQPNQSTPYESNQIWWTRYGPTIGTGTIREFAIGKGANGTLALTEGTARQVVTPEIVKGVDHILDMYYDFTFWPALGQSLANGVLIGTETYNTITQSAVIQVNRYVASSQAYLDSNSFSYVLYEGDISATIEGTPSGTNERGRASESYGTLTQSGSEWYRDVTVVTGIDVCNFPTGISAAQLRVTNQASYQVSFKADGAGTLPLDAGIPKTNTDEIELTYRNYFGRYVP